MFTEYTFQDWEATADKNALLMEVVRKYKASEDFRAALEGLRYFRSDNAEIGKKTILQADAVKVKDENGRTRNTVRNREVAGNRIRSNTFRKLTMQQAMYLLGNGVTLENDEQKKRLGSGFDTLLAKAGTFSLVEGVCWAFWNGDHAEMIMAAENSESGFVALLDESTSEPMIGVQFWRISPKRPMYIRLFEVDGVTVYRTDGKSDALTMHEAKRTYVQTVRSDLTGSEVIGGRNYGVLPLVPFWANVDKTSELTLSVKTKIDAYDRIVSDFADNLDKANDVYWVLNNFGGTTEDVALMLAEINRVKAIANISDGTTSSTAEPHAFQVPYEARKVALELLEKAIYKDYMALSMDALTGGSLTNVAIKAAMTDMEMKANAFEWEAFAFVQKILALAGIETEEISFKRVNIVNDTEVIQNISLMRSDLDLETALRLYPYITDDMIPQIMNNLDSQALSGLSTVEELQKMIDEQSGSGDDP